MVWLGMVQAMTAKKGKRRQRLDNIVESTWSRLAARGAVLIMTPLLGLLIWAVQHEIGLLEKNHDTLQAAIDARSKMLWEQIGKMNSAQVEAMNKLTMVGAKMEDHEKGDDKVQLQVSKSLDTIAQQLRDITVSVVRVPSTTTAAPPVPPQPK